jgi:metallo-beta-lactamase class B
MNHVEDAEDAEDAEGRRVMSDRIFVAFCGAVVLSAVTVGTQSVASSKAAHREAAKKAAGQDHLGLLARVCPDPAPSTAPARGTPTASVPAGEPRGRGTAATPQAWIAEPAKVFDNLYFVGTKEHGAWAVTTSEGIIVIDALYDYAVEDAVVGGLKKLGLDPAQIKYVIVSHGHGDHHGGAKFLQDRFGARVVLAADDWALVERDTRNPRPKRDIVATDGMKLTLGDTTLTLYLTPGHTLGTISTLVPLKDGARRHMAAEWGGTAFSAATPREQLNLYVNSAIRFRDLASKAGADVIIANHTNFDGTKTKVPALAKRKPGDPHPYVIGADAVRRYLTVAEECARAELAGS